MGPFTLSQLGRSHPQGFDISRLDMAPPAMPPFKINPEIDLPLRPETGRSSADKRAKGAVCPS